MRFSWPPRWWPFGHGSPTVSPPPPVASDPFALAILAAHNAERAKAGLKPLAHNAILQRLADGHVHMMAVTRIMDHDHAGDGTFGDRINRSGYAYSSAGENIAEGQKDVPTAMASWMASPLHRANILGDFADAGCQVAIDATGVPYWSTEFGRP